jgi:hypothetical protein
MRRAGSVASRVPPRHPGLRPGCRGPALKRALQPPHARLRRPFHFPFIRPSRTRTGVPSFPLELDPSWFPSPTPIPLHSLTSRLLLARKPEPNRKETPTKPQGNPNLLRIGTWSDPYHTRPVTTRTHPHKCKSAKPQRTSPIPYRAIPGLPYFVTRSTRICSVAGSLGLFAFFSMISPLRFMII